METRRLEGRRIVITRTPDQSRPLVTALEALGAVTVVLPAIRIVPPEHWSLVDEVLRNIWRYQWLVFTSANGVVGLLDRYDQLFDSRDSLSRLRVGVVGEATRHRVEISSLSVALQSTAGTAEDLALELRDSVNPSGSLAGLHILFPTSNIGRHVLPQALRQYGCLVDVIEVYRTEAAQIAQEDLRFHLEAGVDDVVFASPSAVRSFSLACRDAGVFESLCRIRVTCIGRVTASAAREYGLAVHSVADEPTVERIVEAISHESDFNAE